MNSELWGVDEWRPYFHAYDASLAPEEEVAPEEIEILEPAYELPEPQKAPGAPGTLAKRLASAGWSVRARASAVRAPAVLYATAGDDHNKGDVRYSAHKLETFQVIGKKAASGKMLAVVAQWERKEGGGMKFTSAITHDPYLGQEYRPSVTKPRPQREWEKQEDVQPPLGLNQWLDILCPKPAPKNKETK